MTFPPCAFAAGFVSLDFYSFCSNRQSIHGILWRLIMASSSHDVSSKKCQNYEGGCRKDRARLCPRMLCGNCCDRESPCCRENHDRSLDCLSKERRLLSRSTKSTTQALEKPSGIILKSTTQAPEKPSGIIWLFLRRKSATQAPEKPSGII